MSIYEVVPVDPNAAIVVEKISDIPTWAPDLRSLTKMDRFIENQNRRDTRESIKQYPTHQYQTLHGFEFGPKITKLMSEVTSKLATDCPAGAPTIAPYPDWVGYTKIYTSDERKAIDSANQQKKYKTAMVLELEELIISNPDSPASVQKSNVALLHRNKWLHSHVNDLPDLEIISESDEAPYLSTLEVAATKRKASK